MKIGIKIGLWVVVAVLSFLVYQSIAGKIEFEEQTHDRRSAVIQNLNTSDRTMCASAIPSLPNVLLIKTMHRGSRSTRVTLGTPLEMSS